MQGTSLPCFTLAKGNVLPIVFAKSGCFGMHGYSYQLFGDRPNAAERNMGTSAIMLQMPQALFSDC
jgi:hypothetical protein